MCLWCGKGIKKAGLPSLHKECVPPDFGFPVWFESGKTKQVYKLHMAYALTISNSTVGTKLVRIMEVDHSKNRTLRA